MNDTASLSRPASTARTADIVREYGPFEGAPSIHGVTHDGQHVWAATSERLLAIEPDSGHVVRSIDRPGDAGTAFDGTHLYQLAEARIDKIDPATGAVVASIPAPGEGRDSGMAWAEGSLWVGQYRDRCIHQIDPDTGKILRTLGSFAPSPPIASSPASPGSTAICGTPPGRATTATCAASTRTTDACWSASTCRRARTSAAWNPMAPTCSIAAAAPAASCAPCAGPHGLRDARERRALR
jgi:hypothetical protein